MLGLKRRAGETIIVRAPDGDIQLDVVGFDAGAQITTVDITFPGTCRSPLRQIDLAVGEQLAVQTGRGSVNFRVFTFTGEVSRRASVRIGIDAPREWAIERPDMKKHP